MKNWLVILVSLTAFSVVGCAHKKGDHHHEGHHKKHHKNKMWEKMDANGDGDISREEFDKAHSESFKAMDSNNDGKISKQEKKAHWKSKMGDKKGCCGDKKHGHKHGHKHKDGKKEGCCG